MPSGVGPGVMVGVVVGAGVTVGRWVTVAVAVALGCTTPVAVDDGTIVTVMPWVAAGTRVIETARLEDAGDSLGIPRVAGRAEAPQPLTSAAANSPITANRTTLNLDVPLFAIGH